MSVRFFLKAGALLARSWAASQMPRLELLFDEARVFKREVLVIQGAVEEYMFCCPLQVLGDLLNAQGSSSSDACRKGCELAEQAQDKRSKKVRRNSLFTNKAASVALYEGLSNSLEQLMSWSFAYAVPAAPLAPLQRSERRLKTEDGRPYITDENGSDPIVLVIGCRFKSRIVSTRSWR
jgi:hypothetical protein